MNTSYVEVQQIVDSFGSVAYRAICDIKWCDVIFPERSTLKSAAIDGAAHDGVHGESVTNGTNPRDRTKNA